MNTTDSKVLADVLEALSAANLQLQRLEESQTLHPASSASFVRSYTDTKNTTIIETLKTSLIGIRSRLNQAGSDIDPYFSVSPYIAQATITNVTQMVDKALDQISKAEKMA